MRILFVTGSYPSIKCGVGDYSKLLAESIANESCDVVVLTSIDADNKTNNNHLLIKNVVTKWTGFQIISSILKYSKDCDIIHFQFPTVKYNTKDLGWILLPVILRLFGKKIVYTLHEYYEPYYRLPAIVFSNEIIVVEESYKLNINRQYHNLFKDKIDIIRIASNIPKSSSKVENILSIRKNILSKTKGTALISYFGFLNKNKRIELILEAMHRLNEIGELKSTLLIIGDYYAVNQDLIDYQKKLRSMIIDYNLEENIYITGYIEDSLVGDFFRSSDAAILLFENGVSTRNGSFLAAQQEGIDVYTTKPNEDIVFSENIHLISNKVPEIMETIQRIQNKKYTTSEQSIVGNMTWDKVAFEHIKVYSKVLSYHSKFPRKPN